MGLFRKRTVRESASADGEGLDHLRAKISFWFRARQRALADYLNQKTKSFTFQQWLVLLVSFCAGVGGYLLYVLLGIFN